MKNSKIGFVLLAVVVLGLFVLTKEKKEHSVAVVTEDTVAEQAAMATEPTLEVNDELSAQALSTVSGGDTTMVEQAAPVNGTTTVSNLENKLSETEVKELRFCSPKNVSECKVCLTKNCIPEDSNSVASCYTKTENCVEDQPQRRLSKAEIKHFDKIMENNYR